MNARGMLTVLIITAILFSCRTTPAGPPDDLPRSSSPVYISEYMTEDGWLELCNPSDSTVSLKGYRLFVDSRLRDFDHSDMQPGEYRLVPAVKGLQESILLYLLDGGDSLVDLVDAPASELHKSMVRTPSPGGGFAQKAVEDLTPGYPNDRAGSRAYQATRRIPNATGIVFSEIMPSGKNEFIELHNSGDAPVSLGGYGLSDRENYPGYIFPEDCVLNPGQYLAIYCGADSLLSGPYSAGFSISNAEESVYLSDPSGRILLEYGPVAAPKKQALVSVKGAPFICSPNITPGEPNEAPGTAPAASVASGQYDGVQALEVELIADGSIHYTTDGSEPGAGSRKYSGPIRLTRTAVIRAVAIADDGSRSPVSTFTYIINEGHKLDVVSLASDPAGLFSMSGIYSTGPFRLKPEGTEDDGTPGINYPYIEANYWRRWWRAANVSLLPKEGPGFSYDCGASIFGGFSRIYPKKSMKFKFSKKYGPSKLRYRLFGNRDCSEYNNFVIRTGGQDVYGSLIKDDLVCSLADTILDVMASRPAVYYINGQYYGLYFIREKINRHFVAAHYGVPADSLDLIQGNGVVEEGSMNDFRQLMNYVSGHNLAKEECYNYVAERVDLQNYADWVIAEIWSDNRDAGNVRCFKSAYLGDKWRWIFYDTDMGLNNARSDKFLIYLQPTDQVIHRTDLIRGLLRNPSFRELFLSRLEFQMKHVWNKARVHAAIDSIAGTIEPEVARNNARWSGTYEGWKGWIEKLHGFADGRQKFLKQQFGSNPYLKGLLGMTREELDRCFEE